MGTHFSNLPLQVCLYFNVVFFPFWLAVNFIMIPIKFSKLEILYQFILALSLVAVIIIEGIRLYIGYIGNLKEKIPEIASFWLISVLLQTPLQMFLLLSSGIKSSVLERIMQSIMCIFLIVQIILGFIALKHTAKHSVRSFQFVNFNFSE
ncbi:transmembrane protein 17-like [Rhodnius prolixus]|uniref:Putative conserved plasma membrane protein rhodnius neglectus n=1 Tax=Rhodnius prolixus TaxID=13249 RepID=A0A4P6D7C1_RHOPR